MMSTNDRRIIGVLRSECFDFGELGTDSEIYPPGKDLALFLMNELRNEDCPPTFPHPIQGEGGWHFENEIDGTTYDSFVHWAPIGNPPQDCWVIQPRLRKGVLRTLFGHATRPDELASLCAVLHRAIDGNDAFTLVEWLNAEEFRAAY